MSQRSGSTTPAGAEQERGAPLNERDALSFPQVLSQELESIRAARQLNLGDRAALPTRADPIGSLTSTSAGERESVYEQADATRLVGLAFSGGGIRSAVFNLGVLQALAKHHLLRQFDYLSSVSGGGYIAGWLHAWIARETAHKTGERQTNGLQVVESKLRKSLSEHAGAAVEPEELKWLREYSNYLTPRTGVLRPDALAAATTAVRNWLLNSSMLLLVTSVVLLVPWGVLLAAPDAGELVAHLGRRSRLVVYYGLCALASVSLGLGMWHGGRHSARDLPPSATESRARARPRVRAQRCASWLALASLLWSALLLLDATQGPLALGAIAGSWIVGGAAALTYSAGFLLGWRSSNPDPAETRGRRLQRISMTLVSGATLAVLLVLTQLALRNLWLLGAKSDVTMHAAFMVVAAVVLLPLLCVALTLAVMVQTGLCGRSLSEYTREWWSRTSGQLMKRALLWVALFGLSLCGPYLWELLERVAQMALAAGGFAWVATTASGVYGAVKQRSSPTWQVVIRAAPYVFLTGLLVCVARVLFVAGANAATAPYAHSEWQRFAAYTSRAVGFGHGEPVSVPIIVCCGVLGVVVALLCFTMDVNIFSLHMFYRNRLERGFLSRPTQQDCTERWVDMTSEVPDLSALKLPNETHLAQRPYPLINTAINLTRTKRLAWQERVGASFVFSPGYCGYQTDSAPRYQPTANNLRDCNKALSLSTPLTISGAAVSPASSIAQDGAVNALLALFNLRLGWWFQNSARPGAWGRPGPYFALSYLLKEFMNDAAEDGDFVHLSDGGHFENLGVYELVRRRCRYIVACDAGCDPRSGFADLGNAIRKCRTDFGVEIDIDVRALAADPDTGLSSAHCAVGTIYYPDEEKLHAAPGYLLYVKASMTGDEPADLLAYKARHPDFPHDSTADQWFSESQFESYRTLGAHVMDRVLDTARKDELADHARRQGRLDPQHAKRVRELTQVGQQPGSASAADADGDSRDDQRCDIQTLFEMLTDHWRPASSYRERANHFEHELLAIVRRARQDPALRFMQAQLVPEWNALVARVEATAVQDVTMLPETDEELRAGFHFCSSLIEVMELAYNDLHLSESHAHPDNRGLMNLFRHWAGSGMFRVTWAVAVAMHGKRFQTFCERHFKLRAGRVVVGRWQLASELLPEHAQSWSFPNFVERRIVEELHAIPEFGEGSVLWPKLYAAPVLLILDDPQAPGAKPLELVMGMALLSRDRLPDGEHGPTLRYLRIRDHLRNMGIGRRALEALWREDCRLEVKPSAGWSSGAERSDAAALKRLWANVKAAVPDDEIKRAEDLLERYETALLNEPESAPDLLAKAQLEYERARERQPDNEEALRGFARVLVLRSRLPGVQESAAREPTHSLIAPAEVRSLHHLDAAIEILEPIAERNPYARLVHYNLACYYLKRAQHTGSADDLVRATAALDSAILALPALRAEALCDEDLLGLHDYLARGVQAFELRSA